jgi:hypothetical protein
VALLAPSEIKALARIVGDLDYYQLLHLERNAASGDVRRAYHATSRTFHPDANAMRGAVERTTDASPRVVAFACASQKRRRKAGAERASCAAP